MFMSSKNFKILKKFVIHLPFGIGAGLLLVLVFSGVDPFYWRMGILLGFVYSTYFILLNINSYASFGTMSIEDYLECNHTLILDKNTKVIATFDQLLERQFVQLDVLKPSIEERIVKIGNTKVRLQCNDEFCILSVERNAIDFLPDRASNYRLLLRIYKALVNS